MSSNLVILNELSVNSLLNSSLKSSTFEERFGFNIRTASYFFICFPMVRRDTFGVDDGGSADWRCLFPHANRLTDPLVKQRLRPGLRAKVRSLGTA